MLTSLKFLCETIYHLISSRVVFYEYEPTSERFAYYT